MKLLMESLNVITLGLESFAEDLNKMAVPHIQLDWRPPAGGNPELVRLLMLMEVHRDEIEAANKIAMDRLLAARPALVGVGLAGDFIPGFEKNLILHSGPPVTWDKMCGPTRGAVIGALFFEGLASSEEEAEAMAAGGQIRFAPCHHFGAVGPMAGIISASMPVAIVENMTMGNRAFATLNEGLGKVLRFGAYSAEVINRLKWMKSILAPALNRAIEANGPIYLKTLIAQALQMGDECHNRNIAATSLFVRSLLPALAGTSSSAELKAIAIFLAQNDHFFLNLSMAACKASLDSAHGVTGSSLVTAMARNGVEFGIRVSGLGDEWFTAPAPMVKGLYFTGYSEKDANPDLGDSAITETYGIGGFAMAAAPAIVQFVGGTAHDAMNYTREMGEITIGVDASFAIPAMDFQPVFCGIELGKVVDTGIFPVINTGIAHRDPGVGQVGAGVVRAPRASFEAALKRYGEVYLTHSLK
mgnify:CR=1 FL=1